MEALFGSTLLGKSGNVESASLANNQVVGIYFSAHWCPPCRRFTPMLASTYTTLRGQDKQFEVVFVSGDQDQEQFNEYYESMPWLAVPFENQSTRNALNEKFKVQGIPTLILVDGSGNLISKDGRSKVQSPESFPWTPRSMQQILGSLQSKSGPVGPEALHGKTVGLYFSAHWCPPCRGFTPKLATNYSELKEAGKEFEIVFVSSDRDEGSFNEYYETMPWLALPFADRAGKDELSSLFEVQGIPTLVILNPDFSVITKNGRGSISAPSFIADFPYHPKPFYDLSEETDGIDSNVSLVVFADLADAATKLAVKQHVATLAERAASHPAAAGSGKSVTKFFTALGGGPINRIRSLTKCTTGVVSHEHPLTARGAGTRGWGCDGCGGDGSGKERFQCEPCNFDLCGECNAKLGAPVATEATLPLAIILDLEDNGGFYKMAAGTTVTLDSLQAFCAQFAAGALTRQQCE